MVVEAAPLIVGEEDRRTGPIAALHDRVDLLDGPVLTDAGGVGRMLTIFFWGNHPGEGRQVARLSIGNKLLPRHNISTPVAAVANMMNGIKSRPDIAAFLGSWGVILPTDPRGIHAIGDRRKVEAWKRGGSVIQLYPGIRVGVTAPAIGISAGIAGKGDRAMGNVTARSRGNGKESIGKGGAMHSCKGLIGQDVFAGQVPIVGDLILRGDLVASVR